MTTQENIKPLVDRILSNPLHFKLASNKKTSLKASITSSELLKNPSYLVIRSANNNNNRNAVAKKGKDNSNIKENEFQSTEKDSLSNKKSKTKKPTSMAEALAMYASTATTISKTVNSSNNNHADTNIVTTDNKSDPIDSIQPSLSLPTTPEGTNDEVIDDSTSSEDVFHEAKEYISSASDENESTGNDDTTDNKISDMVSSLISEPKISLSDTDNNNMDEDLGEDIGEDIGEDLEESLELDIETKKDGELASNNEDEDDDGEWEGQLDSSEQEHDEDEGDGDQEDDSLNSNNKEVNNLEIPEDEKRALYDESMEYERSKKENEQLKKLKLDITMRDIIHPKRENINNDEEDKEQNRDNKIMKSRNVNYMDKNHEQDENEDEDAEGDEALKHKLPLSQRSVTPPTTISDIDDFYKFNEEQNDQGSILPSRILKNWGPEFSTLKPRGLLNHGVTCYTNAAVQAMLHIPAIQHYLIDILNGKYNKELKQNSVSEIFAETSKKMWLPNDKNKKKTSSSGFYDPKRLISRLEDINFSMSEWQQEDSHEYFMSLMSRLQEDSVPPGHKLTESIIYDIFGGLLKQYVTCKSCGEVSKTEQPFYDLSLHLKGKKIVSLSSDDKKSPKGQERENSKSPAKSPQISNGENGEAINRRFSIEKSIKDFFNPELIKVDNEHKGYVCEKCHKTTNAVKHNAILRAPETLLVHLKKFRFNGTSSSKMKQAVSYPMFMDLTEYCDTEDIPSGKKLLPVKYQLISVVVHEGRSLSSGHYVAHCKQPDGSWANYDDEYINKMSERDVLREPNAYYLVYTRLTPKAIKLKKSIPQSSFLSSVSNGISNNEGRDNRSVATTNSNSSKNSNNKNKKNKNWNKNKKRRFNKY